MECLIQGNTLTLALRRALVSNWRRKVCKSHCLYTLYFRSSQERMVSVYSVQDLSGALDTLYLDTSPATLVPYYDEDTNVAILTGKVNIIHSTILSSAKLVFNNTLLILQYYHQRMKKME